MLLEFIARYYKFLWLGLGAVAFLKIVLSYFFHGNLEGTGGVIYALFKWYTEDEQEIEDSATRRMMRIHNVVTLLVYFWIMLIIAATLLPIILGH